VGHSRALDLEPLTRYVLTAVLSSGLTLCHLRVAAGCELEPGATASGTASGTRVELLILLENKLAGKIMDKD